MKTGEEIRIGKMGQQPMPISDATVDPEHAILRKIDDNLYQIEDNDSAKGVYVYGFRVKRKTINEDTPIYLGKYVTTVQQLLQDPDSIDLEAIWKQYEVEKRKWDRKAMLVNYLRFLPSILTMSLGMLIGADMSVQKRTIVTLALTVAVLVISMLATEKMVKKKDQAMATLNADLQKNYICPHCHSFLGFRPYSVVKPQGCPNKGCSHYGCQMS